MNHCTSALVDIAHYLISVWYKRRFGIRSTPIFRWRIILTGISVSFVRYY